MKIFIKPKPHKKPRRINFQSVENGTMGEIFLPASYSHR